MPDTSPVPSDDADINADTLILATVKENVSLTAISAQSGEITNVFSVGEVGISKTHEIALSQDGHTAFVSLYGSSDYGPNNVPDNRIAVVDLATMSADGYIDLNLYQGPHGLWVDGDGMLWATVDHSQCALVIDPATRVIERTIWLQSPAHFLAPSPDGKTVYFSSKEYPVITVVDVASREITARIPLPVGAQAIRVSPDGARLYVGDFYRPLLHVIDCAARKVVETAQLTGVPGWPFNGPNGDTVIVTTYDEPADRGFAEILDTSDLSRRRVIDLPSEPFHVLVERDNRHALIALADGNAARIDLENATLADGGFFTGGTMAEALVYWDPK